jgi:hypothetical protein
MPEKKIFEKKVYEKKVVKRVGVWSYAKISTIIMAIFGLFQGIFYGVLNLVLGPEAATAAGTAGGQVDPLMAAGPWIIIIMPVMYALMGLIMGIIGAWLYNLIARWVGGVKVEFE